VGGSNSEKTGSVEMAVFGYDVIVRFDVTFTVAHAAASLNPTVEIQETR
jgi:hypothetical protein